MPKKELGPTGRGICKFIYPEGQGLQQPCHIGSKQVYWSELEVLVEVDRKAQN